MSKLSVTQIVWKIYPTNPDMFTNALSRESLDKKREKGELIEWGIADRAGELRKDDVMKTLNQFGTTIHTQAQTLGLIGYIEWNGLDDPYMKSLTKFFNDYKVNLLSSEIFIETDEYCGTADAIVELTTKAGTRRKYLLDWKTWWAYKYIYGIHHDIVKKNGEPYAQTQNLKKAQLQLSMYRNGLNELVDDMAVVWITSVGYFFFPLEYNLKPYIEWREQILLESNIWTIWQLTLDDPNVIEES